MKAKRSGLSHQLSATTSQRRSATRKTVSILSITILCLCLPAFGLAQVPQMINYQSRVSVGGTNFDGTGQFKFALVNSTGGVSFWSNDGQQCQRRPANLGCACDVTGATVQTNRTRRLL
jgi:hypothetical protein